MLAETRAATGAYLRRAEKRARDRSGANAPLAGVIAFLGALATVLLYALRGGAYDQVVFEEYGLVIWVAAAAALAFGLLPRVRPSRPMLVLLAALLLYAAWTALSLSWSESAQRTTTELARTLDYLGLLTLLSLTVGRDEWRSALAGLTAGAMIVCALGLASRLDPGAFPGGATSAAAHFYRLSYPFGYWNAVGAWGAMSIALALGWAAHARRRWLRALALACVPIAFLTVYLSYSRAGLAGTALAALAALVLARGRLTALLCGAFAAAGGAVAVLGAHGAAAIANATGTAGAGGVLAALLGGCALAAAGAPATALVRSDRWSLPRPLARAAAVLAALALIVAAAVAGPTLARRAWHSFKSSGVVYVSNAPTQRLLTLGGSRYLLWKTALHSFQAHPLGGTGAGTFEFAWDRNTSDPEFVRDAHSLWFANLAELGIVGLLLMLAVVSAAIALLVVVRRRARRRASVGPAAAALALVLVYVLAASVDWMWESTAVTVLALAAVGFAGGRLTGPVRSARIRRPARAAAALAAVAFAALQVPGLLSTAEIRASQRAERAGHPSLALAWANDAVSAEPWAASPYDQRGLVLEAAGRYAGAAANFRHAIANEPDNFVHWVLLARVQAERGRVRAAVSDYDQAHRLRPLSTVLAGGP
jgi:hypothetical protein